MPRLLRVVSGQDQGKVFELQEGSEYVLGRADTCAFQLSDPKVSRAHLTLVCRQDKVTLQHNSQINPTMVNGNNVNTVPLRNLDQITVGETSLLFFDQAEGPAASEETTIASPKGGGRHPSPGMGAEFHVGETIGGYEVLEQVGRGTITTVYKVLDHKKNRVLAMKALDRLPPEQEVWAERFVRGARAGGKVHHPNVLRMVAAGKAKNHYFVLSEFIEGKSARQIMDDFGVLGALDPRKTVDIAIQIARALVAARAAGIVHRNIKPENILVGDDGTAKLADLEVAKEISVNVTTQITRRGDLIGDFNYTAPEQVESPGTVDHRADMYCFGATLYGMATGHPPFEKMDLGDMLKAKQRSEFRSPKEYNLSTPSGLCDIIKRAMQGDVTRRYQEPAEMLRDLERVKMLSG